MSQASQGLNVGTPEQAEAQKLHYLISEAERCNRTEIWYAESAIGTEGITMLAKFEKLRTLILPGASFPLERIVEFDNLKVLAVRCLSLSSPMTQLPASVYVSLRNLGELSIFSPIKKCFLFQLLNVYPLCLGYIALIGPFVKGDFETLHLLTNLRLLVLMSDTPVELGWIQQHGTAVEMILKCPITIEDFDPPYDNEFIKRLRLYNLQGISSFSFLLNFPNLKGLALRNHIDVIPENIWQVFEQIFTLKNLIGLDLSGMQHLTDQILNCIVQSRLVLVNFIAVRHVGNRIEGFSDAGMTTFLQWPENTLLERLDISGHTNVTLNSFHCTIRCIRKLKFLGLRRTSCNNVEIADIFVTRRQQSRQFHMTPNGLVWDAGLPTLRISLNTIPVCRTQLNSLSYGDPAHQVILYINQVDTYAYYGYQLDDANSLNSYLMS
jgi:hypothetical protein